VFLVGGGVIVWEYGSSKAKERIKEEQKHQALQQEADELQRKLRALDIRLQALEKVVKKNTQSKLNFGERYVEPEEVNFKIDTPLLLVTPAKKSDSRKEEAAVSKESTAAIVNSKEEPSTSSQGNSQTGSSDLSNAAESEAHQTQGWWGWITVPFRRENTKR